MASTMAVPHRSVAQPGAPAGVTVRNPAATRDQRYRTMQLALFAAGAVLMPLGILAIVLGWYGVAHTKYQYDQLPYVVSGGLLGLGLVFLGGFLYFGAWLAKVANDQRESARQLADTLLVLADVVSRQPAGAGAAEPALADPGAVPVLAGAGATVHRRDCPLIAHRDDLHVLTGQESDLGSCRVCRPTLI
jgi:ABC-type Fe3+ transport system permease subunit